MKTVHMTRNFDYRAHPRKTVRFSAGITYARVIEAAARAIEKAGAGRMLTPEQSGQYWTRDASDAFRPRGRK